MNAFIADLSPCANGHSLRSGFESTDVGLPPHLADKMLDQSFDPIPHERDPCGAQAPHCRPEAGRPLA
jgi:hypothetical protein